jgi:23S rRNA pseudouridine1911/1915/1917 synthase
VDDLNVIYEDNHLLVVDKAPGVLSQSDRPGAIDDLLNRAKAYVKTKYGKPGEAYLGLVHRLDRDVGGVMIFARTSKAAARLSHEIREGRVGKLYRALLESMPDTHGCEVAADGWIVLEDWMSKDETRKVAIPANPLAGTPRRASHPASGSVPEPARVARLARLRFRVLRDPANEGFPATGAAPNGPRRASGPAGVPVEIELETGRFHQIRFQMSRRGAPILGDRKYGARRAPPGGKLALHCVQMSVRHPVRDEILQFVSPVPSAWST